jgi:hypothetical protein
LGDEIEAIITRMRRRLPEETAGTTSLQQAGPDAALARLRKLERSVRTPPATVSAVPAKKRRPVAASTT